MKKRQIDKVKKLDLALFDAKLRAMAENGTFDDAMEESLDRLVQETEPEELTANELKQFYQTVKKASVERAIMEARSKTPVTDLPLGRFLQLVRDRSGLSHVQVARVLNKDASFIERIENGQTDPLSLMADEVVDIMQLFHLTLTEMMCSIKAFLSLAGVKRCKISGMARSSVKADAVDKGERLAHAMDAALHAITKKKTRGRPDSVKIDPGFMEAIKKELKQRKAEDLLV